MSFDPITESIAHFIGAFNMSEEAARARAEYDSFRAAQAAEKKAEILELHSARLKAPHQLEGFDPGVIYKAPPVDSLKSAPVVSSNPFPILVLENGPLLPLDAINISIAAISTIASITFSITPASSIIGLTFQFSTLSDNDTFGSTAFENYSSTATLTSMLKLLSNWALELSPVRLDLVASSENWYISLKTVMDAAPNTAMTVDGPMFTSVFSGADAVGYIQNGEVVSLLSSFEDFLPLFHIDPDAENIEDSTDTDDDTPAGKAIVTAQTVVNDGTVIAHDFTKDFEDGGLSQVEQEDGHHVVAGANMMVNQTVLFSNWLDAKVFVVAGNVLNFDAISQTNMLVDHDGGTLPVSGLIPGSTVINAAGIVTNDNLFEDDSDVDDAEGLEGDSDEISDVEPVEAKEVAVPTGAPQHFAVTTITGNVTQINWVDQVSFITDHDRADITIKASKTFIGLGENESVNTANFWEIGFQYDIIVIAGNLIDVNIINQLNVMIDSDFVQATGATEVTVAEAAREIIEDVQTSVNAATQPISDAVQNSIGDGFAQATQIGNDPVPAELPSDAADATAMRGSEETNALTPVAEAASEIIEDVQTSVNAATQPISDAVQNSIGDGFAQTTQIGNDPVSAELPSDAADATAMRGSEETNAPTPVADVEGVQPNPVETTADAPASGISTSDNLLFNSAEIITQGEDTTTELLGEYQELAEDFVNGEREVSDNILDNGVFDGVELLRVLFIDGDFNTINVVNQTNVLGDTDQVRLSAADFAAVLNDEIQVTTGSNIQANIARITDAGQSTEIHAGGEVYSDALIHQAELVDTNASPTGVNIHDLTNEAVAFLVDGMIEPGMAENIISSTNDAIASAMSSSDLMQQMLG